MQNHHIIIQKTKVRLYTNSKKSAYNLKDHIHDFLKNVVFEIIEEYLSDYESEDKNEHKITVLNQLKLNISVNERNYNSQLTRLLLENDLKNQLNMLFSSAVTKQAVTNETEVDLTEEGFSSDQQKIILSKADIIHRSFLYFLKNGVVPWYCGKEIQKQLFSHESIERLFTESTVFTNKFIEICREKQSRKRFIYQLDENLIISTLQYLFFHSESTLTPANRSAFKFREIQKNKTFNKLSDREQRTVLKNLFELFYRPKAAVNIPFVFHYITEHTSSTGREEEGDSIELFSILKSDEFYERFLSFQQKTSRQLTDKQKENKLQASEESLLFQDQKDVGTIKKEISNTAEEELTQPVTAPDPKQKEEGNEKQHDDIQDIKNQINIILPNAGLIITYPFLQTFFSRLGLLNEDLTIKNPELGAHLLHYLATGDEQAFEYELAFEKLLCGIPQYEPVERFILIPEEMKKEADELLGVILSNWPILRNSGVELLQHEFLQREGTIVTDEQNIVISFERKAQDILIDKLEWTLSFIKLPWISTKVIRVNW